MGSALFLEASHVDAAICNSLAPTFATRHCVVECDAHAERCTLTGPAEPLHEALMALAAVSGRTADFAKGALDALNCYRTGPTGQTQLGSLLHTWGSRTLVMGIINATPDSFSGDGLLGAPVSGLERAVEQGLRFVDKGADILDVGGESTRPGADPVSENEELGRVVPVIAALRAQTNAPISVDTYRSVVAQAALDAGADIVNDVWGLRMDPGMARIVAESGVPVIIMHNRSQPRNAQAKARLGARYVGIAYDHLLRDVLYELSRQVEFAKSAGIRDEQIILDPGIGFGKTVEQNIRLISQSDQLRGLGYPLLIGPSRKSFIGYTLDVPPTERVEGTLAAVGACLARGAASIVRVHDVEATSRFVRMWDAF